MNRKDLPSTDDIRNDYPQLQGYNFLWISDYYDGPIRGMMESGGKKYWFEWIGSTDWVEQYGPNPEDCDLVEVRFFAAFDLGKERMEYEEYWYELFRLCVGTHCDYDSDGNRSGKVIHNKDSQKFFYGRKKADYKELDIKNYPIVGWFVL